jgi:hypothetical protein
MRWMRGCKMFWKSMSSRSSYEIKAAVPASKTRLGTCRRYTLCFIRGRGMEFRVAKTGIGSARFSAGMPPGMAARIAPFETAK